MSNTGGKQVWSIVRDMGLTAVMNNTRECRDFHDCHDEHEVRGSQNGDECQGDHDVHGFQDIADISDEAGTRDAGRRIRGEYGRRILR